MTSPEVRGLVQRTRALLDLGRNDEARVLAGQVLAVEPDNVDALCLSAQANLHHDWPAALEFAKGAIARSPENEWAYRLAGAASLGMRDVVGAANYARRAVTIAPLQWQGHSQLAYALREQRETRKEAVRAGSRAVNLAPNEPRAQVSLAWAQASAGHKPQAEAAFREALRLDPNNASAHRGLASLAAKRGAYNPQQLASAASGFATAVRAQPRDQGSARAFDVVAEFLVLRMALIAFIGASLAGVVSTSATVGVRALCVLGACASLAFGAYFFWRLPANLRGLVRARMLRAPSVIALAFLAVGLVLLLATAVVPANLTEGLRGWGLAAALIAALIALIPFIARRRTRQKLARKGPSR